MRGSVHEFDFHVEEVDLFEEILNVLVFDVEVGVEPDADGRVTNDVFLSDAVWVRLVVHSLAKDLLLLLMLFRF